MASYESLLKPEYDRDFFLDYSQRSVGKYGEFGNTHEDSVAKALSKLLRSRKQSQKVDMEDKLEVNYKFISPPTNCQVYTDDFFCALRDYVGMENSQFSVSYVTTVLCIQY